MVTGKPQSREAYDRGNGATTSALITKQNAILTKQFRLPWSFINGNPNRKAHWSMPVCLIRQSLKIASGETGAETTYRPSPTQFR